MKIERINEILKLAKSIKQTVIWQLGINTDTDIRVPFLKIEEDLLELIAILENPNKESIL